MRKRVKNKAEVPELHPASGAWWSKSGGRKRALQTLAVWVGSLAALVVAVYLFKKAGEADRTRPIDTKPETPTQAENPVSIPLILPDEDDSDQVDPPAAVE